MSNPITWRSIQVPTGTSEAAALLRGAQYSMDGAFTNFDKILQQREANLAHNMGVETEAQKQAYLDLLSSAKTPEQLAALQPRIAEMQAGLTVANRAATRDAEEARLSAVRNRVTQEQTYTQQQKDLTNKPATELGMLYAAQGNVDGLKEVMANNPGINWAPAQQALTTTLQSNDRHTFAKNADARQTAAAPFELDTKKAEAVLRKAQADAVPAELGIKEQEANQKTYDTLQKRIAEDSAKLKEGSKSVVGDKDGLSKVMDTLKTSVPKELMGPLGQQLAESLQSNPEFAKLPVGTVATIAQKYAKGAKLFGGLDGLIGGGYTKEIQADLTEALKNNPAESPEVAANRAVLAAQIQQMQGLSGELFGKLNPGLAASIDARAAEIKAKQTTETTQGTTENPAANAAPVERAVETPGMRKSAMDSLLSQLAKQETSEISRGIRKEYSPEVQEYLPRAKQEAAANADAMVQALKNRALDALGKFAPLADIALAVPAAGANALGANFSDPLSVASKAVGVPGYGETRASKIKEDGDKLREELRLLREKESAKKAK